MVLIKKDSTDNGNHEKDRMTSLHLIAELSESILENPEENAFSSSGGTDKQKGPSPMKQLLSLARYKEDNTKQSTISKLALMSLMAIFKDILPSYRVRVPTSTELAADGNKLSKDTKRIWEYEQNLLQAYQSYLKILEQLIKKLNENVEEATTAMLCLTTLFQSSFHFNFRSHVLQLIVQNMNVPQFTDACCQTIQYIFQHDKQGDITLEITRQMTKHIRDKHYKVAPQVLDTFLQIPLRVHADEAQAAKQLTQVNKKKRKRDKQMAEIESELKESEATTDKLQLARHQSDTLETVMTTYFRILKSTAGDEKIPYHIQQILPTTLNGLAKFAHLINIDTVMDLLQVLKGLLQHTQQLPLEASLHCILTALETLQGPGKEMKIDPKEYVVPLYSQLPRLIEQNENGETASRSSRQECTRIVLRCLHLAFVERKEYSNVRVAAFFKQILTVSLHVPVDVSVPLVAMSRQLLQRYPSIHQLLENEQDVITSGQYVPEVEDPEHTNPLSTSAWELSLLRFHIHEDMLKQSNAASQNSLLQIPSEIPDRLLDELIAKRESGYIRFLHALKRHPLAAKQSDKRSNARFITPRKQMLETQLTPE